MFPNIDPKKLQSMMKQMGIAQEEIPANRVIIEKENSRIVIDNPNVTKVKVGGAETFQISGEAREEDVKEEAEEEKIEADIATIMEKTGVSREIAALELEKHGMDLAETIIDLNKQSKKKK